jgi:hypothetical protein
MKEFSTNTNKILVASTNSFIIQITRPTKDRGGGNRGRGRQAGMQVEGTRLLLVQTINKTRCTRRQRSTSPTR